MTRRTVVRHAPVGRTAVRLTMSSLCARDDQSRLTRKTVNRKPVNRFSVREKFEPWTEPKYSVNRFSVNRNLRFEKSVNREPNRNNWLTVFSVRLTEISVRLTVNRVNNLKKEIFLFIL